MISDVWVGPGATLADHDAFMASLSLDSRNAAPMLAIADGDGRPARLIMASVAFFGLFSVTSGEALAGRLLAGRDPGARRLAELSRSLPLDGAPRLERLRFLLGPSSEVITFLCRRSRMAGDRTMFIAAALGMRTGLMRVATPSPFSLAAERTHRAEPLPALGAPIQPPGPSAALPAPASGNRRARFVWQTDAEGVCRDVSAQLAAIVGEVNGDIRGHSLLDLAPKIDPSGALASALAARSTWSGLEVNWPIADAAAAVAVNLGAVAVYDKERVFAGFRGYGVVQLDRMVVRQPVRLVPSPEVEPGFGKIVPFPGAQRGFSAEDEATFAALGAELRGRAGLDPADAQTVDLLARDEPGQAPATGQPIAPVGVEGIEAPVDLEGPLVASPSLDEAASVPNVTVGVRSSTPAEPQTDAHPPTGPAPASAKALDADRPAADRDGERRTRGDNSFAVLNRLAIGLLVSRANVPIFANRHLLDMLGFADEDAIHEAGGLNYLFEGEPADAAGGECVVLRGRDGSRHPTKARMQRIEWDGLPASLLTLQSAPPPVSIETLDSARDAALEELAHRHADARRHDLDELRRLRAILETASDGVAVIDARGRIVSLNRSAEALFGRDRGTIVGRLFVELFAPENRRVAEDYMRDLTTNAARQLFNDGREILVRAPQDGTIPVFMTLGRLDANEEQAGETGSEARYCALFRDLTHWKKVEMDLQTARRDAETASAAKTDFLAKVSHEIRTPLNSIIGFAEIMLDERFGPVGSERYRDYLRDILTSGTHVMSLVNDLLDLSKIEAGQMRLDPAPIDVNQIITECVGLMQPHASRERVITRLSLAPHLPMINADERSLRQIVLNLVSNAVKYNEPGGQVIVATAAPEDGKVVIRVRDTGPGMSEDDIAAALEPFRQVSSRSLTDGTGLGLPLTKALVEANEATFVIRSKRDHGTLVEVVFPPARVLAGQR